MSSTTVSTKIDIKKILPSLIKSTRPYFLSSALIQIISYLILLLISPMSCTKYLGSTFILYVFINYITHCTFFSSCVVIILQRIKFRDHCLLCHHLLNDSYRKDRKKSIKVFFQKPIAFVEKINPIFKTIITGFICLLSLVCIIYSAWLILSIDTNLYDDKFLPRNATSLRSYMKSQTDDYELGPVIMYVIPRPIDYSNKTNQLAIHRLVEQCLNETATNNFKLVWLEKEDLKNILTSKDPINLRVSPYSQNDLIVSEKKNKTIIEASRFYCQFKSINGSREDLQAMNNLYRHAQESSIPSIFPYSLIFPHYEALRQIRFEVYLLILLMIVITLIVTLLMFFSFGKALIIFIHTFILLSGYLTCLYVFHKLSFNFANATWLFMVPAIYLDTIIHSCFNITKSKWKYNRIIFSLIISLLIFSFFPIETYIYHVICYSLIYQSIICFILINIVLPSWNYIIERISKKKNKNKTPSITVIDRNQALTDGAEAENLVNDPHRNMNDLV